jgi:Porin subfamily
MKSARNFVLGTVAGLMAVGGAQAADLPVKAKAIEYVKICSQYGAGFFFIPGTDTCIKLGGYVRADVTFNGGGAHGQPAWNGDAGQRNRYFDNFVDRSRFVLTVDTRTATEYGVVRTFGSAKFQFTTLGGSTFNPNSINGSLPVASANLLDTPGGGYVAIYDLFVQFAGFTFGKSASAYASPWQGTPGNNSSFLLGGQSGDNSGTNNIQYTADFGNGVTGSIGLDDPTVWDRTNVFNLSLPLNATLTSGNAYAGVHAPEVVGNIRVDQAWGLFQISAAAHEVNASYNILNTAGAPAGATGLPGAAPTALSEISGHPDTKWGGAVMAALQIKNLPTGKDDDLKLDASYSVGNTKQVISTSTASPSFAMFSGTGVAGAYQSMGLGVTTDAVWMPAGIAGPLGTSDGQLKLTKAWGIRGAFNHNWDPYWSTSLFGSYASVRYDGTVGNLNTAKGQYCAAFGIVHTGQGVTYTCDPNYNAAMLGVVTRWTPIKNLAFSAEALWFHLDQKMGNGPGLATSTSALIGGPGSPKPATVYEFRDQNAVSFNVRVQRNY